MPGAARAGAAEPRPLRLALAGGGTGGHLAPGRHLLAALAARGDLELESLLWLTSGRGVEERFLAQLSADAGGAPFERVVLALEPRGGGAPTRSALLLRTPRALLAARAALRRARPHVILGLGGFTSLPAVLAARTLGVPVALLEVNAVPGAATRMLAPLAARVLHAFRGGVPAGDPRHVHVGPLLPPELARVPPRDPPGGGAEASSALERAAAARRALGLDPSRPLLVVLGGSQGAGSLNAFVRACGRELLAGGIQVLHQTGPGRLDQALGGALGGGPGRSAPELPGYRALEFTGEVPRVLAAATLVLCRGGASTLAEVAAAGAPAVVVPYPHAADRHQEKNALELGRGARVVADSELGPELGRELARLIGPAGEAERAAMRVALAGAVPRDGADRALDVLAGLVGPQGR